MLTLILAWCCWRQTEYAIYKESCVLAAAIWITDLAKEEKIEGFVYWPGMAANVKKCAVTCPVQKYCTNLACRMAVTRCFRARSWRCSSRGWKSSKYVRRLPLSCTPTLSVTANAEPKFGTETNVSTITAATSTDRDEGQHAMYMVIATLM